MNVRTCTLVVSPLLVLLAGCDRVKITAGPSTPPRTVASPSSAPAVPDPSPAPAPAQPTATVEPAAPAQPVLEVRRGKRADFGPGTAMETWNIRAARVGKLTVRLLAMRDGQSATVQEGVYEWTAWPSGKAEAAWRLHYLVQGGDALGARGKWLPAIALDLADAPPNGYRDVRAPTVLTAAPNQSSTVASDVTTIEPGKPTVLFYALYGPSRPGLPATEGTVESLEAASKSWKTVVAIVLAWTALGEGGVDGVAPGT